MVATLVVLFRTRSVLLALIVAVVGLGIAGLAFVHLEIESRRLVVQTAYSAAVPADMTDDLQEQRHRTVWRLLMVYGVVQCVGVGAMIVLAWLLDGVKVRQLDAMSQLLRMEKERLQDLVNAIDGVVWEREADPGRFMLLSESADGFLGFSLGEWKGRDDFWLSRVHPLDRARVSRAWQEHRSKAGQYSLTYRVTRADGGLSHVQEDGFCIPGDGGKAIFRGVFTDVTQRVEAEAAAEESKRVLVENSRQAGMAELATGVLHNVGNILNTLNVSARLMADQLSRSRADHLDRAAKLIEQNMDKGAAFFTEDPRGRALPQYLVKLGQYLKEENGRLQGQMKEMLDRIEHIRDVIVLQQKHGRLSAVKVCADLGSLVDDALRLEADALENGGVQVERSFVDLPPLLLVKSHILQILVNLINNARHAVAGNAIGQRLITVSIEAPRAGLVSIVVADNGCGIPASRLTQIFAHGFTTRQDGHGFGLHHAALLARDMDGCLKVESEGSGKGARFTLELPFITPQPGEEDPEGREIPAQPSTALLTTRRRVPATSVAV